MELFVRLGEHRGRPEAAVVGACVALALGIGTAMTWIVPATGAPPLMPPKPVHAIAFIAMGVGIVGLVRGWLTIAAVATLATLCLMAFVAIAGAFVPGLRDAMLIEPVGHGGPPSFVAVVALSTASAGVLVWIVGNGPLRPVRRACALLVAAFGAIGMLYGLTGVDAVALAVPSMSGRMSAITAVGLVALGLAVHEVERDA